MGCSRYIANSIGSPNINFGSDSILTNIFSGGGTVCFWARPTASSGYYFEKNNGWNFSYTVTGTDRVFFVQEFSGTNYFDQADVSLTNVWGYFSFVYDSSSTSNRVLLYYNGNLLTNSLQTAPTGSSSSDSGNDLIFVNNASLNDNALGYFCYPQIWDRQLSQSEIVETMHKPGSVRENLIGFWSCIGDSPERDLSGNGNNGTVTFTNVRTDDGPPIRSF